MAEIEIINGENITEMSKLQVAGRKYNLIFLDPPYFDWGAKAGYREWALPDDLKPVDFSKLVSMVYRLQADSCRVILFGNQPFLNDTWSFFGRLFKLSFSIMVRRPGRPVTPFEGRAIMREHEEIWMLYDKEKKFSDCFPTFGVHSVMNNFTGKGEDNGHPTQKSLSLTYDLIRTFSRPGDKVLDPFFGSGTTGVACKELGLDCTGIEINPKFYELAKKRVEESAWFNSEQESRSSEQPTL